MRGGKGCVCYRDKSFEGVMYTSKERGQNIDKSRGLFATKYSNHTQTIIILRSLGRTHIDDKTEKLSMGGGLLK